MSLGAAYFQMINLAKLRIPDMDLLLSPPLQIGKMPIHFLKKEMDFWWIVPKRYAIGIPIPKPIAKVRPA